MCSHVEHQAEEGARATNERRGPIKGMAVEVNDRAERRAFFPRKDRAPPPRKSYTMHGIETHARAKEASKGRAIEVNDRQLKGTAYSHAEVSRLEHVISVDDSTVDRYTIDAYTPVAINTVDRTRVKLTSPLPLCLLVRAGARGKPMHRLALTC